MLRCLSTLASPKEPTDRAPHDPEMACTLHENVLVVQIGTERHGGNGSHTWHTVDYPGSGWTTVDYPGIYRPMPLCQCTTCIFRQGARKSLLTHHPVSSHAVLLGGTIYPYPQLPSEPTPTGISPPHKRHDTVIELAPPVEIDQGHARKDLVGIRGHP